MLAGAAAVLGVSYAAVSAYWALDGTVGLDTLGGTVERLARERSGGVITVLWLTVLLKLVAAALGVAAVRPRRTRGVRPLAWCAGNVLAAYGALLSVVGWLALAGAFGTIDRDDESALRWHALLWDPWFLVWGLLLLGGLTASRNQPR